MTACMHHESRQPSHGLCNPVQHCQTHGALVENYYTLSSQNCCAVSPDKMPWGTHAYIVSSRQAERMALTADMMMLRSRHPVDDFHSTSWQLDGEDIKIDHYLSMYYSDLTPQDDKRRCDTHTILWAAWREDVRRNHH